MHLSTPIELTPRQPLRPATCASAATTKPAGDSSWPGMPALAPTPPVPHHPVAWEEDEEDDDEELVDDEEELGAGDEEDDDFFDDDDEDGEEADEEPAEEE